MLLQTKEHPLQTLMSDNGQRQSPQNTGVMENWNRQLKTLVVENGGDERGKGWLARLCECALTLNTRGTTGVTPLERCHPKICLWDIGSFKLVIFKKHKTQEERLTFPQTS